MTEFIFTILSVIIFYMLPIHGMDVPVNNDFVSYKGLKKYMYYLPYGSMHPVQVTRLRQVKHKAVISIPFAEVSYLCFAYKNKHGPQRAQKIIAALRALPNITPIAISKLYISVLDEVITRDGKHMNELVGKGQTAAAFKIHQCLNVRKEADGTSCMMTVATTEEDKRIVNNIASSFLSFIWGAPKAQEADKT